MSEESSSPYYSKIDTPIDSPIPSSWNMMNSKFRQFIVDEFYWHKDEITPELIQTLTDKYEANVLLTGDNGHIGVQAPLLVAVPTNKKQADTVLLMLIRKLNTSRGSKATKHGNQVALVNWEQKLKAIPSHLPLMCLDPAKRIDKSRVVYNSRANQNTWLVPEITQVMDDLRSIRLNWISIRDKLEIHSSRQVSAILGRIKWQRGPWIDGPEEKLLFNDSAYRCHRNRKPIRPPKAYSYHSSSSSQDIPDDTRMAEDQMEEEEECRDMEPQLEDSDDESSYHPSMTSPLSGSSMRLRQSPRLAEFRSRARLYSARSRSKSSSRSSSYHSAVQLYSGQVGEEDIPAYVDPDPTLEDFESVDLDPEELSQPVEEHAEPLEDEIVHVEAVQADGNVIAIPDGTNPLILTLMEQLEEYKLEAARQRDRDDERWTRIEERQSQFEQQNLLQVRVSALQNKSLDGVFEKIDLLGQNMKQICKSQKLMSEILLRSTKPKRLHPRDSRRNPHLVRRSSSHSKSRRHSESY